MSVDPWKVLASRPTNESAVYFGSVGVKKTRYAVTCGLIADFTAIIAGIFIAYLFFHWRAAVVGPE